MVGSALDVFGKKPIYTNVKNTFKKPWFTKDCKIARRNFRRANRLYKKFGGDIFKEDLYEKEKLYKNKLKCANLRHRVEMKKQLCNLKEQKILKSIGKF